MRVRYLLNYQHWKSIHENPGNETENCKKKLSSLFYDWTISRD
jgi:hypothetical protein